LLAFTFPGQGSQRSGMGGPWTEHPSWEVVGEASEVAGRDIGRLLLEAEQDELTLTANAQLATFVLSLVVLDAIERVGVEPTLCAGHSLGEYTALAASGALGFEDGVRLVVERGEAMHDAAEERSGTMAAILGASDDDAEAACQRAEGDVWVANYNAPGQIVIAGDPEAVARAGSIAKEFGARKVMPIPVAGAFHTALMAPARARLRKALSDAPFNAAEIPVVANVDARAHRDAGDWPGLLSAQLCGPVRWRQSLETLAREGATRVVEVGPGGVLTGDGRLLNRDTFNWAPWEPPVGNNDDSLAMLRCTTALRRGKAKDFLVFGRMQRPAEATGIKVVHWESEGQVHKIPAVFHAAWQNPQGRFGITLANWTNETQAVSLSDARLGKQIVESISAQDVKTRPRQVNMGKVTVSLPPLSCALVETA